MLKLPVTKATHGHTGDMGQGDTLSHCSIKKTKNPKNAKITHLTVKLSHCHTKKTKRPKNAKIVELLNEQIFLQI
jgi:hypothetical protein